MRTPSPQNMPAADGESHRRSGRGPSLPSRCATPKAELATDAGTEQVDLPCSAEPVVAEHASGDDEPSSIQGTSPLALQVRAAEEEVTLDRRTMDIYSAYMAASQIQRLSSRLGEVDAVRPYSTGPAVADA